jgi:hypothetical protein
MLKPIDAADLAAGWAMTQEQPAVVQDDAEAWGHVWDTLEPEQTHVAGLGGPLGRMMGRSLAKSVKRAPATRSDEAALALSRILGKVPPTADADLPPSLASGRSARTRVAAPVGPRAAVVSETGSPFPDDAEFNLARAHPGSRAQDLGTMLELADNDPQALVGMIESAEDFGTVLNELGETMKQRPRTQEQVAREASLETLYTGVKSGGLLNDRQLYALRSLNATLWDQYKAMADQIDQGNQTPEVLGEYLTLNQSLTALLRFQKGQTREVARALAQQRMVATTLDYQDIAGLEQALDVAGNGKEAILANAKALSQKLKKGMDPAEALKGSIDNATLFGATMDVWKSNNLSSFATQTSNAVSSIAVSAFELGQKGLAAAIGAARRAAGAENTYEAAEFGETIVGAMSGVRHSLAVFWNTLTTGETELGARAGKEAGVSQVHAQFGEGMGLTPNQSELLLTPAYRVMQAMDEALMYPTYMAELSGLAARNGISLGLTGDALRAHVDNLIVDKEPPYEWREQALAAARKVIMQSQEAPRWTFSALAEHAYRLAQAYPVLGFIIPWIRTPARILDYSIEATVLNAVNPKLYKQLAAGGPDADIAGAKIVSATSLMAVMYPLVDSMSITGAGPADPDQRKIWEAAGWQAYSFRVGGKYVSYKNWADPLMGVVGAAATAMERGRAARDEAQWQKLAVTAIFAMSEYMLDSSYLEGFKRLITAFEDPAGKGVAELAGGIATGFVPLAGLTAQVARTADDAERAKTRTKTPGFGGEGYVADLLESVEEDFKLRMPGWRDTARPRRYWDGEIMVPEEGRAVRMLTSLKMRAVKDDAATAELVEHGVSPAEPRSRFTFLPGIEVELIDLDEGAGKIYDDYILEVGKARRVAVDKVISATGYAKLPPEQKMLALEQASHAGLSIGQAKVKVELARRYKAGELPRLRTRGVTNDVIDRLMQLPQQSPIGFQP